MTLFFSIIPVIITGVVTHIFLYKHFEKNAATDFSNIALTIKNSIDSELASKAADIQSWAQIAFLKNSLEMQYGWEEAGKRLKNLTNIQGGYAAAFLTNIDGKCLASSMPEIVGKSVKEAGWFKEILDPKKKMIISDFTPVNFLNTQASVVFVHKIEHADGLMIGAIVTVLDWPGVLKKLEKTKEYFIDKGFASGYAFIVGRDNDMIIGHPDASFNGKNLSGIELGALKEKITTASQEQLSYKINGENRSAILKKCGIIGQEYNMNWTVIAGANISEIRGQIGSLKNLFLITGIIIILISLLVSYLIAGKIVSPVSAIAAKMKKITAGDIKQEKIIISSGDEIAELASAFNELQTELQTVYSSIQSAADDSVLPETINLKGDFGEAIKKLSDNLKKIAEQAQIIARDDLYNSKLTIDSKGIIGSAFSEMVINLRKLTQKARFIANDDLLNPEISTRTEGSLGSAFSDLTQNLLQYTQLAWLIASGNLNDNDITSFKKTSGILNNAFYDMIESMKKLCRQASAIADGDLNAPILNEHIQGELGDRFKKMSGNLRTMITRLEKIISEVKSVSNNICVSSASIDKTANNFITKSKTQLMLTNDAETALTEFSTSINEIAQNCEKSKANSVNSRHVVNEGLSQIKQVSAEMENITESIKGTSNKLQELNESSRKIGNIINIITEISEKTSLLALNAAIEAARAGELGRGFAVVADEVNKLADQTQKSVKEISMLVETIRTQTEISVESMSSGIGLVSNGVKLVDNASDSFQKISCVLDDSTSSITEISSAVKEQNDVIRAIVDSIEKLKNISEEVSSQSEILKNNSKTVKDDADKLNVTLQK